MLAIAIKNTILVILIILIIHFLIKTFIMEKSPSKKENFQDNQSSTGIPAILPSTSHMTDLDKKYNICTDIRTDDLELKKQQQEELMRYVATGDDEDSKILESYFKDNMVSRDVKDIDPNMCKRNDDHHLPLSTTCDTKLQSITSQETDKRIIADCNLPQDKNVMILTEYENEKDINGGAMFGGLSGFDNFDLNYESYSC